MSFFSFIKDVGEKILGLATAAEINAADLKKDLDALGLDTKDLTVELDGDNVVLKGTAKDLETLEKDKMGIAGVKTDGVKVATAGEESKFYEVKKGDTLWKIAEECYGKGKGAQYNIIFEANTPMLKHPDKIYPGQKLRIPPLK